MHVNSQGLLDSGLCEHKLLHILLFSTTTPLMDVRVDCGVYGRGHRVTVVVIKAPIGPAANPEIAKLAPGDRSVVESLIRG